MSPWPHYRPTPTVPLLSGSRSALQRLATCSKLCIFVCATTRSVSRNGLCPKVAPRQPPYLHCHPCPIRCDLLVRCSESTSTKREAPIGAPRLRPCCSLQTCSASRGFDGPSVTALDRFVAVRSHPALPDPRNIFPKPDVVRSKQALLCRHKYRRCCAGDAHVGTLGHHLLHRTRSDPRPQLQVVAGVVDDVGELRFWVARCELCAAPHKEGRCLQPAASARLQKQLCTA